MVVAAKKLVPLKKAAKKAPVEEEEPEIEEVCPNLCKLF
jgi:hypothetical protein